MTPELAAQEAEEFRQLFHQLKTEIQKRIVGQDAVLDDLLIAFFSGGHVLMEGVPGLGKTLLVRTLAEVTGLEFSRIQFTPDLMPSDIVGTKLIVEDSEGRKRFEFQKGPVFANLVLADEINRATPKTQSALLEAMQERHVTVSGETHPLPSPFLVLATQNPLEMEGTYPLPEAQLDRFMFKVIVRFPSAEELRLILNRTTGEAESNLQTIPAGAAKITQFRSLIRQVPVATEVEDAAIALILATHPDEPKSPEVVKKFVRYGASPRGGQALLLGAKILALLDGRYHVSREDLKRVAPVALRHRLILNFEGEAEGVTTDEVIRTLV